MDISYNRLRPVLVVCRGLPASGKTTWALDQVRRHPDKVVRVNRDQLRLCLGHKFEPKLEKLVSVIDERTINSALEAGYSVINDDTNLSPKRINIMAGLASTYGAQLIINDDFLQVPVEECIKRDAARDASVGKDVIERMYFDYWKGQPKPANEGSEDVIICDLDGTLALIPSGANPYERDFSKDGLNEAVAQVVAMATLYGECGVIFMSGRDSKYRDATRGWLRTVAGFATDDDNLIMRVDFDRRKDTVVKKELYMQHVQGKYRVRFVLDDRPSVVRMWRAELGLTVFQVGPNIEF